jgi:hypothetical protein
VHDTKNPIYLKSCRFTNKRLFDSERSIVEKTVPCAIRFRVDLMAYFGSLNYYEF